MVCLAQGAEESYLTVYDLNRLSAIACLQFDHLQLFESTTDCFALQLYGEFNWKYGQIGLLCSPWFQTSYNEALKQTLIFFKLANWED